MNASKKTKVKDVEEKLKSENEKNGRVFKETREKIR